MKIVTLIKDSRVIDRIIRHLELSFQMEHLPPPIPLTFFGMNENNQCPRVLITE